MKTILFLAFCLTLSAVAITDETVDITLKETAHTLSVQGDTHAAANQCLRMMKDATLTPEQAKRVYPVLVRVMRELNDREMILQAIAACEKRQVICEELRVLQSFAAPMKTNPDTVQIRDAIEYMWTSVDWKNNENDFKLFQTYLEKLSKRTNISLVARAQALILKNAIGYAFVSKLPDPLREQQYKRMIMDLNRVDNTIKPVAVYEALQRLYVSSTEYLAIGEKAMARGGLNLLSYMSYNYSNLQTMPAGDLVAVFCGRISDRSPYKTRLERHDKHPLQVFFENLKTPLKVLIERNKNKMQIRLYSRQLFYINPPESRMVGGFGLGWVDATSSVTTVHQLLRQTINEGNSNLAVRITLPDMPLDLKSIEKSDGTFVPNFSSMTVTGYWSKVEIQNSLGYVSNEIAQIVQPLEELRKYAERTEKRSLSSLTESEKIVAADRSDKLLTEEEVRELWREFIRIGTKDIVKGKALLKKLKPYLGKMKEIKNSIEYLYIEYPDNRKFVQGRIYEIDYQLIKPASNIHMKRWEFWSRMPEVEAACEVLQAVNSTNNLEEISRKLMPRRLIRSITTKDICTFYIAAGYDLKKGLSLDESRTFWNKLYAYYNYVIMNPEIENNAAYIAFLIEQLLPVFVQSARVRPNAFQFPEKTIYEDDLTRAQIITAFQAIISHTNTTDKPVFVEKTIKQLVKDLRADANVSVVANDDEMEGTYASLMRSFLDQGKVDSEKGRELLDMISALPDMPLAGPEFNELLIAYPDDRIGVYKALHNYGLLSGYKKLQWAIWATLPWHEDYAKQIAMADNLEMLKTLGKSSPPKNILKIMQDAECLEEIDQGIMAWIFPFPKYFQSTESYHAFQKAFVGIFKDIVELPEKANPNIIAANAIEKLIPVYIEIAKNNPEGLIPFSSNRDKIASPLIRKAIEKIEKQIDSPDIAEIVEKTYTELVKKLREVSVDSRSNAEGTILIADDKLGGSYGESSVKLGVFLIKVEAAVQRRYRLDTDYGMLVYRVKKLSPASKAGIMARDVIIGIGGKKVDNPKTFTFAINEAYKSDKNAISITVKRRKELKELMVEME